MDIPALGYTGSTNSMPSMQPFRLISDIGFHSGQRFSALPLKCNFCPSVGRSVVVRRSVGRSVRLSVCHKFLKGWEDTPSCSYRSPCQRKEVFKGKLKYIFLVIGPLCLDGAMRNFAAGGTSTSRGPSVKGQ